MTLKIWSFAATGLSLACHGMGAWEVVLFSFKDPPKIFCRPAGIYVLIATGFPLALLAFFFGYRIFADNGLWGLIQFPTALYGAAVLAGVPKANTAFTPPVCLMVGAALAIWMY